MRKVMVFNAISLDGFFTDKNQDMSWAHARNDREWRDFTSENAGGEALLAFGRVTYDMMASYWPTPQALKDEPVVAKSINKAPKIVFSKTLEKATWENTKVVKTDPADEVRRLKNEKGPDILVMGSGTIVSQLTAARLVDEYQLVVNGIILGAGRTLFEGVKEPVGLVLEKTRAFKNGNVVLWYARG
jgi:dihydrofolate reductase